MRYSLAALILFVFAVSHKAAFAQPAAVTIPHSQQFDLQSAEGRAYRIFIAEPKGNPPPAGYAVFYVLDANAMFMTAVDAARFQHGLVPTVVVGIGYPTDQTIDQDRRYFDYTPLTLPEHILHSGTEPPVKEGGTGGQEEFFRFIQETVKPEIAHRFKVDPKRQVIFGHSLAGRFVLHLLFTHPESFSTYVAASPSIWWDNRSILDEAQTFIDARKDPHEPLGLLMTVGEMEQKTTPATPKERADFLAHAKMVDNARELSQRLQPLADTGLHVLFVEYPEENHGSVVPFAISRAIRFSLQATPPARPR